MVKSAERVLQILEAIGPRKDGVSHGELSAALNIPKSSLSSLLSTLTERGYILFGKTARRYFLGSKLLILAGHHLENLDLVRLGQPILRKLTNTLDESTEIAARRGYNILILCKEDCSRSLKMVIQIGDRAPLYATAAGKAILAYLYEDELEAYLESVKLKALAPNTNTITEVLRRELKAIRAGAIAYSREELDEGMMAMAAPIFTLQGRVAGSIVVPFPTSRFTPEREKAITKALRKATERLSYQLGFDKHVTAGRTP